MTNKVKIAIGCGAILLVVVVVVGVVSNILHKANITEFTSSVDMEYSTVSDIANQPRTMGYTETEDLSIRISEEAGGFREDVLLLATEDYCESNSIVGEVVIIDASVDDSGLFTITIETDQDVFTFSVEMDKYVE